ncbi:MAG TPA: hypothetical protein PKZ36_00200 [Candidatus Paceibacterota bacterium]|nr:hypothetical protein [Candidatus Paceibacterota bacterium]HPT17825.1 hypothetical protein [Candidatus Paceibacterota bacterium]
MKKTAKKVKSYASNVNIVDNNNLKRKMSHILLAFLGSLAVCYGIILISMVFNIVERQSLASEAKTLSNEVGGLELEYLSMSNKIDLALSKEMGFRETDTKFAVRESFTALRYNTTNEL